MRCYKCIINSLPAIPSVVPSLPAHSRHFRFCRPRLRRKRAHRQNDSIMHTASAALRSLVLFFSCSLPLFVCYFAGTHPKRHRSALQVYPPPYNISRGILLENRFEFLVDLLKCLRFCLLFPGTLRSNENAAQKKALSHCWERLLNTVSNSQSRSDELQNCHLSSVAAASADLDDAGVAAVAVSVLGLISSNSFFATSSLVM